MRSPTMLLIGVLAAGVSACPGRTPTTPPPPPAEPAPAQHISAVATETAAAIAP